MLWGDWCSACENPNARTALVDDSTLLAALTEERQRIACERIDGHER